MSRRSFAPLALFCLVASQVPAAASTFYVVAKETTQAGVQITTEILVTNPMGEEKSFTVVDLKAGIANDGTSRDGIEENTIRVPAGKTVIVTGLTKHEEALLEISAPVELVFQAQLVPTQDGERGHPVQLPIISSRRMIQAGGTGFIQNVEGITNLGVTNLADEPAVCDYALDFADGRAQGRYQFVHQPRSQAIFHDVLDLIFAPGTRDLNIRVTCNKDFFPFGDVVHADTGQLGTLNPSQTGFSSLTPPGETPACPPNATCYDLPAPYVPRSGSERQVLQLPIPPGTYTNVEMQLEVIHGGWNGGGGGFYNMFYLAVNGDWGRTIAFTQVRQPNQLLHDHGGNAKSSFKKGVPEWIPGERYIFNYIWDTTERKVELVVTNRGKEIARLNGAPQVSGYTVGNGAFMFLEFSLPRGSHFAGDRSSLGWDYNKFHAQFVRQ